MLKGEFAEMTDDILHLGVVDAAVLPAEISQSRDLIEDEVCNGEDNDDSYCVGPNHNHGDNACFMTLLKEKRAHRIWQRFLMRVRCEPTENTEKSGHSVDESNGADELEGWECRSPTCYENEPILGKCNFQEKNLLDVAKVLHDTTVRLEHGATNHPSGKS